MTNFEKQTNLTVKYCPQCEGEFVARLQTCPDCDVALTVDKPAEPPHLEPVEIFSSTEAGLLGSVRATLTGANIAFRQIERSLSQAIIGSVTHETVILVGRSDAERAAALLDDLPR